MLSTFTILFFSFQKPTFYLSIISSCPGQRDTFLRCTRKRWHSTFGVRGAAMVIKEESNTSTSTSKVAPSRNGAKTVCLSTTVCVCVCVKQVWWKLRDSCLWEDEDDTCGRSDGGGSEIHYEWRWHQLLIVGGYPGDHYSDGGVSLHT